MEFNQILKEEQFLYLYADCFVTKGAKRTLIYNSSSGEMHLISSSYYELFDLFHKHPLNTILKEHIDPSSRKEFEAFVFFLVESQLAIFLEEIDGLDPIGLEWDSYSIIDNAVIDIRAKLHDFENIYRQLDKLLCKFILIRFYNSELCSLQVLEQIASLPYDMSNLSLLGIQLVIPFDEKWNLSELSELLVKFPIIRVIYVYNSPEEKSHNDRVVFIKQNLSGSKDCGFISENSIIFEKSMQLYIESQDHNSCLNRKISIDENGEIKNCPAMFHSYGNIQNETLNNVVLEKAFTEKWFLTKDQISVCKDCEYRYVCSDCRANTVDNELYGKPLHCSYNPYEGRWETP